MIKLDSGTCSVLFYKCLNNQIMARLIQIEGKRISASKVRGFLFSVANSIRSCKEIVGSADVGTYGTKMSLVLPDGIFTLSMSGSKGGILC